MKAKAFLLLSLSTLGLGLTAAAPLAALPVLPHELLAVVGRPLTPVSYAGVARRTTRRAVVATSAAATPYPYW